MFKATILMFQKLQMLAFSVCILGVETLQTTTGSASVVSLLAESYV